MPPSIFVYFVVAEAMAICLESASISRPVVFDYDMGG
jgi:hypothetical protein